MGSYEVKELVIIRIQPSIVLLFPLGTHTPAIPGEVHP